jgi:uncharacterized protein involved in exopolysaccharide biosynthesis
MFKSEDIDLKHYWFIVRRQKRMILSAVCVCVLLATILNLVTPPTYRSTTRIEVSKEPTRSALTGEAIASEDWRSDNVAIYTTAELITSRSLLREVVASLSAHGIMKSGATHAMVARRVGDWVSSAGGSRPAQAESGAEIPAGDDLDREIDWLLTIISVKPIRETRLVSIEVEHRDPKVAREIADTVAQKFVEYQKRTRSRQGNERVDYLKIQVAEVAKDIEALEGKLYNSRQAGLPVLESKLKQLTETNGGLNDAWVKTRIEKAAAAERLSRVEQALKDSTVNAAEIPIQSETLESLRHDLQQREAELAKAREVYRDKHPKLLVLESELDAIRRSIRAEGGLHEPGGTRGDPALEHRPDRRSGAQPERPARPARVAGERSRREAGSPHVAGRQGAGSRDQRPGAGASGKGGRAGDGGPGARASAPGTESAVGTDGGPAERSRPRPSDGIPAALHPDAEGRRGAAASARAGNDSQESLDLWISSITNHSPRRSSDSPRRANAACCSRAAVPAKASPRSRRSSGARWPAPVG